MLSSRLCLVEARQATIVPFIETPSLVDGDICLTNLFQHCLQGNLGSFQHRSKSHIKVIASVFESFPSCMSLLDTLTEQEIDTIKQMIN